MKINVVFPCFATKASGGHKVLYEYINKLCENNHEIACYYLPHNTFYQLNLPDSLRKIVLDVYIRIFGPRRWFPLNKRVKNKLLNKVDDADIIIATAMETVDPVIKLSEKKGEKFYFIQGFENWKYTDEEVYKTYSAGMTNIVVAKWLKEIVDEHSFYVSHLISNCIDTTVFCNRYGKRRDHSIVFHYRSAECKGPEYALKAIEKLHDKYSDLLVEVISTEDRPENLPDFCLFHRSISTREIAEINNRTEVFMCTSVEEGFGLPGLEAMACGCAVASFEYKGVLEYAVDGENALLSPIKDVESLVANIVKLFDNDTIRNNIIENGVQTGKERSLEKSAKEFEKILMVKCR